MKADLPGVLQMHKYRKLRAYTPPSAAVQPLRTARNPTQLLEIAMEASELSSGTLVLKMLRALVGGLPDGVVVADARGSIVFVNERIQELSGYEQHQLTGAPIEMLVPEDRRADHTRQRHRYLGSPALRRMGTSLDISLRKADGSDLPVDIQLSPLQLGGQLFSVAAVRDISSRKEEEAALRESEDRYRSLVEAAPVMVSTLTKEGVFTSLNAAFERITGFGRDDWLGRHLAELVHPDDVPKGLLRLRMVSNREPTDRTELRVLTKSGDHRVLESVAVPLVREGEILGVLDVSHDVTEAKEAQARVRLSEQRFRKVFDEGPLPMVLVDLDERVAAANQAMGRFLQCDPSDLLGNPIYDFVEPDEVDEARWYIRQSFALKGPGIAPHERRFRAKDGRALTGNVTASVVTDDNGEPVCLIKIVEDITKRKELEKELAVSAAGAREVLSALTSKELLVLEYCSEGMTAREVAERLVVSVRTVESHLASSYRKLDVRTRQAAIEAFVRLRRAVEAAPRLGAERG